MHNKYIAVISKQVLDVEVKNCQTMVMDHHDGTQNKALNGPDFCPLQLCTGIMQLRDDFFLVL